MSQFEDTTKLRRPVDGDKPMELALFGSDLCDVEAEEAGRIGLELLLRRPVAHDIWQSSDPVVLQREVQ